MRVLVLGASGMIGSAMFRVLSERKDWAVFGTLRSSETVKFFNRENEKYLFKGLDVAWTDELLRIIHMVKPDVLINCIGLTKHLPEGNSPIHAIAMNALLPHRLAQICEIANARLIHVSTDCVFSGDLGNYREEDAPDAPDVYGKTKLLGEVITGNVLTLRTSTIGHELRTRFGLLEWFLHQQSECQGFRHAIFSGLTSVEFARVVRDIVIPSSTLKGLYHVGAGSIDKLTLLQTIARIYRKKIDITNNEKFRINRSLNTDKFRTATGYLAPSWPELIEAMHQDHISRG